MDLWNWYLELMVWQDDGLRELVTEVMKDMTVWHVRAFVAFRTTYLAALREEQERSARSAEGDA